MPRVTWNHPTHLNALLVKYVHQWWWPYVTCGNNYATKKVPHISQLKFNLTIYGSNQYFTSWYISSKQFSNYILFLLFPQLHSLNFSTILYFQLMFNNKKKLIHKRYDPKKSIGKWWILLRIKLPNGVEIIHYHNLKDPIKVFKMTWKPRDGEAQNGENGKTWRELAQKQHRK
jgi:hypothetical protein